MQLPSGIVTNNDLTTALTFSFSEETSALNRELCLVGRKNSSGLVVQSHALSEQVHRFESQNFTQNAFRNFSKISPIAIVLFSILIMLALCSRLATFLMEY